MHNRDSFIFNIAGAIPEVGPPLAFLAGLISDVEQNEEFPTDDIARSISEDLCMSVIRNEFPMLAEIIEKVNPVASAAEDIMSESRETYVKNGFRIQEGDVYLRIGLQTNVGKENQTIEVYFRNGSIVHIDDTGAIGVESFGGRFENYIRSTQREWEGDGYLSRESYDSIE